MINSSIKIEQEQPSKRFMTVIQPNLFNKEDPFIYRPVGFKGEINFSDVNNVRVIGQFAFDAWIGADEGLLFLQVSLAEQVVSMVPIKVNAGVREEWEQHFNDMLWTAEIDIGFNIKDNPIFNASANNQEIILGFELQIFEEAFINNIGIYYSEEIYLQFISDLKLYPFQTKFNYTNTYEINNNTKIDIIEKIDVVSYNKTDTVTKLVNTQIPVSTPLQVGFPNIISTRTIDYLMKFNALKNIKLILRDLQYEIKKFKKGDIHNYEFKFNNDFTQSYNDREIIIKNKLSYEYDLNTSSFVSRPTSMGTFILEQSEKIIIKGQMIVEINGINYYLFFEYITIPQQYEVEFSVY